MKLKLNGPMMGNGNHPKQKLEIKAKADVHLTSWYICGVKCIDSV